MQSRNPEGIREGRFVIASANLFFNWGEKQDFCFEELIDASCKRQTKVKNSVFKSPSLLALNCISLLVYIPKGRVTGSELFASRKIIGIWGLKVMTGRDLRFCAQRELFSLVPGYGAATLCLTVKNKVLL